jgi:hypothetical protein
MSLDGRKLLFFQAPNLQWPCVAITLGSRCCQIRRTNDQHLFSNYLNCALRFVIIIQHLRSSLSIQVTNVGAHGAGASTGRCIASLRAFIVRLMARDILPLPIRF